MKRRIGVPHPRESDVQAAIIDFLRVAQRAGKVVSYWRSNAGAFTVQGEPGARVRTVRVNFAGCPDILGVLPGGRLLAIEVKARPTSRLTPAQRAVFERWTEAGALALVAWSVDQVKRAVWQPEPDRHVGRPDHAHPEHPHGCEGSAL